MRATGLAVLALAILASACAPSPRPAAQAEISFRYSRFEPSTLTVPAGIPVTITLRNDDPIEHEWIVGPSSVHQVHRAGTEAFHGELPTEVTVPPYQTRTTTVVFDTPGNLAFICHLPGHEAYGMTGSVSITR